jgi:hypothetical protein
MPPLKQMRAAGAAAKEAEAGSEVVPEPPEPDVADAAIGTETAQQMAARYLPDCARLFASVAFGRGSKAKLHSRVQAATQLVKIASGLAQEVPDAPDEG